MKNLIFFLVLFLGLACSAPKSMDTSMDSSDLKLEFSDDFLKTKTDITVEDFQNKTEKYTSFMDEMAAELMEMDDGESVNFRMKFENGKLVVILTENEDD